MFLRSISHPLRGCALWVSERRSNHPTISIRLPNAAPPLSRSARYGWVTRALLRRPHNKILDFLEATSRVGHPAARAKEVLDPRIGVCNSEKGGEGA
jgi:hypothetical protein